MRSICSSTCRRVFLTLVALGAVWMESAAADNYSFLKNTPLGAFTDEDHALMTQNVEAVVTNAQTPAKRSWQNPQTGHSGTAESLLAFSGPKGESCKRIRVINKAGSRDGKATYTLCNGEAGWQLASSDYAPMPKSKDKTKSAN